MINESTGMLLTRQLAALMLANDYQLATAESCTGGGIAQLMTSLPGSSQWFERGFVTYSNDSKRDHKILWNRD